MYKRHNRERERNKRDSRDRVAIRLSGVRVKCRWTEAITICQSEYKKRIKITSITIMTGKGTETRRKKERKKIK